MPCPYGRLTIVIMNFKNGNTMKKIIFAIAIVMTMGLGANAQRDAFFKWSDADNDVYRTSAETFTLPDTHGGIDDFTAPLGSGLLILTALGAGYAVRKRSRDNSTL